MSDIKVLWLDDDSPETVSGFEGVNVVTAQSCREADELLSSGVNPDWAVVDLIVPQAGWGESVQKIPGLSFIRHLKERYGEKIGIVAFSIVMPERIRQRVLDAGASEAIAKSTTSWAQVLEDLRSRTNDTNKESL